MDSDQFDSKVEKKLTRLSHAIEYKGHRISTENQGPYWTASIKEKGKISYIQIPGQYDSEAEAVDAAKSILD